MKKKQKEMYDDYKRNPVQIDFKKKKDEEEKGLKLYYFFILVLIASFL